MDDKDFLQIYVNSKIITDKQVKELKKLQKINRKTGG